MDFLRRLFTGSRISDPRREAERAEAWLAKGEAERALEVALRLVEAGSPAEQSRARGIAERARRALVEGAIEKAALAESSEYFEDAAEWLESALEHTDGAQRGELEERRQGLLARAREAESEDAWEPPEESEPESEKVTELDPDSHYLALVDMLSDQVAVRYSGLPAAFRSAYVDFNEGRLVEASAALDELAEGGEDPVIRLERGRCRLLLDDAAGAAGDFEAVWETFGDEPLDLAGELSVPALWAEAKLALGGGREVIERLGELADPAAGNPTLSNRYAEALLAENRLQDARRFLVSAVARFPSHPDFPHQLALTLGRLGDRGAAIDCLETAIAPSCAGGRCARPAKHLPSIRVLVSFYLDEEGHADRVHQLMTLVAQALRGRLSSEDHALLVRYYRQIGDPEAADLAAAAARELRDAGADAKLEVPSPVAGGALNRPPI